MATKVGKLIKEARTGAELTQEKLARKVGGGLTASDISKAERGELELPLATLKKIAKATGVTQASLINAAKGTGKSTAKTSKSSKTTSSMRLTAAEKKLVTLYREADSDTKKAAVKVLKGESGGLAATLLEAASGLTGQSGASGSAGDSITDMLGDAIEGLLGGK